MNFKNLTAATLGVVALGAGVGAHAAVFTDRASFDLALTSQSTVTFDGLIAPGFGVKDYGANASIGGVMFSDTSVAVLSSGGPPILADTAYGSDYLEWQDGPHVLTLTFQNGPVTAVAFDFMESRGHASSYTVDIDGVLTNLSSGGSTPSFFGYTSTTAFSSITFNQAAADDETFNFYTMDNVSYGTAKPPISTDDGPSAVPEPATWALMIAGFGMTGATLRQRRRVSLA